MYFSGILTCGGFLAALLLSLGFIAAANWVGWVDRPDQCRKHHRDPTPSTGGLALWLVLILAKAFGCLPLPQVHPVEWAAIHSMALLGAIDDRFGLRARHKALAGLWAAALLALHSTGEIARAGSAVNFLHLQVPPAPVLLFPLLLMWFWGIPQAFNLIDGVNGLSTGLSLLVMGVLGWRLERQPAVLWGALFALLLLNFPRARQFLGDCGALMLGTLFAILGARLFIPWNATLMVWLMAYPILDVTMVVAVRAWNRQPLGAADRSHLHYWMLDRLEHRVWLVTPLLLGLAGLPMLRATNLAGADVVSFIGLLAVLCLAGKAFLDQIPPRERREPTTRRPEAESSMPPLEPGPGNAMAPPQR